MESLASAVSYGFNVMVLGERGSGKTTLVNLLAGKLEDEGRRVLQLTGARFGSAADALAGVAHRLSGDGRDDQAPVPQEADPLQGAYRELAEAAGTAQDRPLVILDGLVPGIAHEVFGRLRDEIWPLGLQWIVTGDLEDKAVLLAPPADAFFEQTITLAPLPEPQIEQLLIRRDPDDKIDASVRTLIAQHSMGNPGRALVLARQALLSPDPTTELSRGSVIDQIEQELGEPAARLADDLARNGPSGPSDPRLLRRIGWSRPRAYQVFQALQHAGFTELSTERTGKAGRPTHTYRLKGLT
jgi:energy-coupling factor transporter ATP-binding protein EcfA2